MRRQMDVIGQRIRTVVVILMVMAVVSFGLSQDDSGSFPAQVLGQWHISKMINSDISTDLENPPKIDFVGKNILYTKSAVLFENKMYAPKKIAFEMYAPAEFAAEFGSFPAVLGVDLQRIAVVTTTVSKDRESGIESSALILKNADEMVLDWHGVFLIARKLH